MRRLPLGLALFIFGCTSPAEHKLPSASITPKLEARPANAACGDDITLYGDPSPDLRYTYDYDADGNVTHATGVYTGGGANDDVTYTFDNLDRMTHMLETRAWGDTRYEITADYDSLGELVDYITDDSGATFHDNWTYTYSQFNAQGEPAREVITEAGQQPYGYNLTYDTESKALTWTITFDGLTGPATVAHFHGPAEAGKNAGVALLIGQKPTSPAKGSAMLTDAQAADLMAGRWYVNVHTAANGGGEIRGQVTK